MIFTLFDMCSLILAFLKINGMTAWSSMSWSTVLMPSLAIRAFGFILLGLAIKAEALQKRVEETSNDARS